jgi:dihydroorotate dehydrogenase
MLWAMSGYRWIRNLLFRLDPERIHKITLDLLSLAGMLTPVQALLKRCFSYHSPGLPLKVFGLEFPNPIGLAAGYDKDGIGMNGLACLGFGHLELGTVTPRPQKGNPRPRIFRLPQDQALINRMGFPNAGAEALSLRLQRRRPQGIVIGVNIGKGVETPLEEAYADYLSLLQTFYAHSDYLAVNISSPNTVGLRRLQARDHLEQLLETLVMERSNLRSTSGRYVPLLVKLAPDLSEEELEDAIGGISNSGFDGVIATNTTIAREGLHSPQKVESGGLSGIPLRQRALGIVTRIHRLTSGKLPIIGVGGIFRPDDAKAMLEAGASLVQVYSGLVYRGPGLVKQILKELTSLSN